MTQLEPRKDLGHDIDYLYCPKCKLHIPCRRLEMGGWEVECPGCLGECGICRCYLRTFCFTSWNEFPPISEFE